MLVPPERRTPTVGSDHSLTHALERVLDVWQSMAARDEFTDQTYDKFSLRQLADKDQRSRDDRIDDCLNYPLIYELAELLPPPSAVGCPRGYPPVTYLLIAAMMTVTGSKRSALGTLSSKQWRSVRSAVRRHAGRRAAILLPAQAPNRHQYL